VLEWIAISKALDSKKTGGPCRHVEAARRWFSQADSRQQAQSWTTACFFLFLAVTIVSAVRVSAAWLSDVMPGCAVRQYKKRVPVPAAGLVSPGCPSKRKGKGQTCPQPRAPAGESSQEPRSIFGAGQGAGRAWRKPLTSNGRFIWRKDVRGGWNLSPRV